MFFGQTLSGTIFISAVQNVLTNNLLQNLGYINGIDAVTVLNTSATDIRKLFPQDALDQVPERQHCGLQGYIGAFATGWKSVAKDKKGKNGKSESENHEGNKKKGEMDTEGTEDINSQEISVFFIADYSLFGIVLYLNQRFL